MNREKVTSNRFFNEATEKQIKTELSYWENVMKLICVEEFFNDSCDKSTESRLLKMHGC